METDQTGRQDLIEENSTTAENITAWKELLSSPEAKEFVNSVLEKAAVLFGQTHGSKIIKTITNIALMMVAFGCIGYLAEHKLVSEGTTGVLAGIIIGYFFKKES